MYEDDTTYTLLAKYNLLVGNVTIGNEYLEPQSMTPIDFNTKGYGLQSLEAKAALLDNTTLTGTIAFADSDESRKMIGCEGYECHYGYLTNLTSHELLKNYGTSYPVYVYDNNSKLYNHIENYESYLKSKGYSSVNARLMTYNEATNLGCSGDDESCIWAPSWVYTTTYWLSTVRQSSEVWLIASNNLFDDTGFEMDFLCGIRPVITILKSEI